MAPRRFAGRRLLVASHNAGKVGEIADMLAPFGVAVVGAAAAGLAAPDETGATCRDNAVLKARAAATATGLPALADDSGLEIAALGGWPGVHSADVAGPERDYVRVASEIDARLAGGPDRRARLVCVLALAWPDGHLEVVEGEVAGVMLWPGRGAEGWGLDPYFAPGDGRRSFAEMPAEEKNALSHRGRALQALVGRCFERLDAAGGPPG